jgi:hypothetical protein
MDKRTIYNIARNVKASDFFNSMDGYFELDEEIYKACFEFYSSSINESNGKNLKKIKIDGYTERINKINDAYNNIKEPNDEYHKYLESIGIDFLKGNVAEQIVKIGNKYLRKLSKLKEEDGDNEKNDDFFIFESVLIDLSSIMGYEISKDISIVEFTLYINKAKNKIKNG